jgi:hypothetical protein
VTDFMSICKPMEFDLNSPEMAYGKVTRSIRDNRSWHGDYVLSLPYQVTPSTMEAGEARGYQLVWRTSLIAVADSGHWIAPPEALSPKAIADANFISDGVVYRYPAIPEGLRDAFASVVGYPKFMLSSTLTDELLADILTTLMVDKKYFANAHGDVVTVRPKVEQTA